MEINIDEETNNLFPGIPLLKIDDIMRYGIELELVLAPENKEESVHFENVPKLAKFFVENYKKDGQIHIQGFPLVSDVTTGTEAIPKKNWEPIDENYEYLTKLVNITDDYWNAYSEEKNIPRRLYADDQIKTMAKQFFEEVKANSGPGQQFEGLKNMFIGQYNKLPLWKVVEDEAVERGNLSKKDFPVAEGLEFVSPILFRGTSLKARAECKRVLENMYKFISKHAIIIVNEHCSSHVHACPGHGSWTLEDVKRVACAGWWFEPAINDLLPAWRRNNLWCLPFRYWRTLEQFGYTTPDRDPAKILASFDMKGDDAVIACLKQIMSLGEMQDLIELLNPEKDAKFFRWNFRNLSNKDETKNRIKELKGTIEFRAPPGSENADEAFHWAELATSLMLAAKNFGTLSELLKYSRDMKGLMSFMRDTGAMTDGRLEVSSWGEPPRGFFDKPPDGFKIPEPKPP